MNTVFLKEKGDTLLIAHRGLSGIERENTLPAFVAAANRTYFGIETDVHKTKDGRLVLIHDGVTTRVSGEALTVSETDFDTLRARPHLDTDGKSQRADLRIPELTEYIRVCHRYGKVSVLELKSDFTEDELDEICALIEKEEHLSMTVFISFSLGNLLRLRARHKDVTAQYLVEAFTDGLVDTLLQNALDLDIYFPAMTRERVDLLHAHGIKVNVWTVDSAEKAKELIDMGVDMITSNILE